MWAFSRNQQVQAGDSFRQELEEKRCSDSLPPRDRRQGPHRGAGSRVGEIVCLVLLASPCCFSHFLLLLLENKQLLGAGREAVWEEVGGGHALLAQQGSWPGLPRLTHFPGC